ncbi:hypothetical protein LIER_35943 [Lithospermum erythrorhizon]|uniref:Uncharacterized protein n=1 Tax=Lithospermum erythrorhizon TaxID=34254 RepID=A0AAV3NYH8_LITER
MCYLDRQPKGQWAPAACVIGFVSIVGCFALHTAIQQLGRSPDVRVSKKNKETIPEVFHPDTTIGSSSRFVDKSFFRKISEIQDPKTSPFPELHDSFTW